MRPVYLSLMFALAVLFACPLHADGPSLLQSYTLPTKPVDVDVSPTGGQIAVAASDGITMYDLRSDGKIGLAGRSYPIPNLCKIAITHNGRRVFALGRHGLVHWLDRDPWRHYSHDLGLVNRSPSGIFMIEDPPLLYTTWANLSTVYILDQRNPADHIKQYSAPEAKWEVGGPPAARGDGSRVFWGLATINFSSPILYSLNSRGTESWQIPLTGHAQACCLGPDPEHLLLATQDPAGLYILGNTIPSGPTVACPLRYGVPWDMALTPDGNYLVVADYSWRYVTVISGPDLRSRIRNQITPEAVRQATLQLAGPAPQVAVHPTKPVAYLVVPNEKMIQVVSLSLP